MTTQPTAKVTFSSLAEMTGSTEQEVKNLLKSYSLSPDNLTQVQIDSIKAELNKGIQIKTHNSSPTVKVPMSLSGDTTKVNLPVRDQGVDLESMSIDEIIQYQKQQDEAVEKQKLIAQIKAKNQELIDLKEQNLATTLENESAQASYQLRLESQPQLLALSIDNAKSLQSEMMSRDITALTGMTQAKRETPTSFEVMEVGAKKSQRMVQNRLNVILNSTEELVPTMRLTGTSEEPNTVTVNM